MNGTYKLPDHLEAKSSALRIVRGRIESLERQLEYSRTELATLERVMLELADVEELNGQCAANILREMVRKSRQK